MRSKPDPKEPVPAFRRHRFVLTACADLRELSYEAASGPSENRDNGASANLDGVAVGYVRHLNGVVVQNADSDIVQAVVQQVTNLGANVHQADLAECLKRVLSRRYRIEFDFGKFVHHPASPSVSTRRSNKQITDDAVAEIRK